MRHFVVAALAAGLASPAIAKDEKFVGVWEGNFATPLYTKLVFHKDKSLTYCDVMSCRQINCMKMDFTGSPDGKMSYRDDGGSWEFERISDEEIEGKYTNPEGDVALAIYEPE